MGDLADTLSHSAAELFNRHPFHKEFIEECLSSEDSSIKDTAEWAQGRIATISSTQ